MLLPQMIIWLDEVFRLFLVIAYAVETMKQLTTYSCGVPLSLGIGAGYQSYLAGSLMFLILILFLTCVAEDGVPSDRKTFLIRFGGGRGLLALEKLSPRLKRRRNSMILTRFNSHGNSLNDEIIRPTLSRYGVSNK
ncbi:hypothetical protein P8452_37613 [Trifolium repens]|nr:hypothetical protein P8452_37613 [Trifolium repens]